MADIEKKAKKEKKPREFSKMFVTGITIVTIVITVFTCVTICITGDTSALPVLVTCVFAELATGTGFYYAKAAMENKIKLKKDLMLETLKMNKQFTEEDIVTAEKMIEKAELQIDTD